MAGGDSAPGALMLRGRRNECAVLDRLLADTRAGHSGVLVLVGEAGVGKTALLEYAIRSASEMLIVRASGVESEMELAFAALHHLCAPLLDRLDRLPGPQREALEITFGLSEGAAPDRFFVGLAALGLLSAVAVERRVLCVVDDAQWLDKASAQTLAFVARRLLADSVMMLFAARAPGDDFAGLPELMLEGLRGADARSLLASALPARFDDRIADQLLAETRGNPLALLELPRGLTAAQLAGGFGLPGALSLEGRIEKGYLTRLDALPEDTQRLVLVAAAEPTGDHALLLRAAEQLAISRSALGPAESVGLIEIDGRVRFRHPLVRSAVYRTATREARRRVHQALADATDAEVDPDRRAWHLAEAAAGPDEDVAAELDRAAGRAQARGGLAAAAAFLERAATLTPEPSRRARRALAAAQTKYEAGALDDALALLGAAEADALDDPQRARVHLLRAEITFASRRGGDAPQLLLSAARGLEAVDPNLARTTYLEALSAAAFVGRLARDCTVVDVSEAVLAGLPPPGRPRPPDLLLQGLAVRFTAGYAAAAPMLREALGAFVRETSLPWGEARWLWFACWVAADVWDDEAWTRLSRRQIELVRDAGALTSLPLALSARIAFLQASGELASAASMVLEVRAVAEALGIATPPYGALWDASLRGHDAEFRELIDTTISRAQARGEGFALAIAELVSGILYNGLGDYRAAIVACRHAGDSPYDMGSTTRAVAELIEAAIRSGERQIAERALERLTETTRASGTEFALGVAARSQALLDDGDAADRLYREAVDRLERTTMRVDLARAHLLYGEWLRRERRRLDAREQLRTAHEMFLGMGIEAFAARAERELLATGEHVRKRRVETREELTVQESQVAFLARDGLSNSEIGERLFISQHTVAYHLRKVFLKLGITSRNELARVLPEGVSAGQVA